MGLAVASGALLVLCFPRFDLAALAWVALVPLLLALEGKGPGAAYLVAWTTGLVFFAGIFHWIFAVPGFNLLDYLILDLYLSQYLGLWGLGLAWIRRRTGLSAALVAPPLWVTLEYARSNLGFLALPWMLLGHSQHAHPVLIQVTSLTGVYGLSFLIVLANVAVAEAVRHAASRWSPRAAAPPARPVPLAGLVVAGLLLVATAGHGLVTLSDRVDGDRLQVALVQGNIPQDRKWDRAFRRATLERYARLTREAAGRGPALIVWPETAVPGDVRHDPELHRVVGQLAVETRTFLLVGTSENAKFTDRALAGKQYNGMVLFTPEGRLAGEYRKIVLVPFGEYAPLRGIITWPRAIVATAGTFAAGNQYTIFPVRDVPLATTICWENIFPDVVREFVRRGARLIVNATNEAWFLDTPASHQFLAISVFRAVENRVAVARAANTGISAFIDPFGRVTRRLQGPDGRELFVEGVLHGGLVLPATPTFYTRHGDLFAVLQIAASLGLLASSALAPAARTLVRVVPTWFGRPRKDVAIPQ